MLIAPGCNDVLGIQEFPDLQAADATDGNVPADSATQVDVDAGADHEIGDADSGAADGDANDVRDSNVRDTNVPDVTDADVSDVVVVDVVDAATDGACNAVSTVGAPIVTFTDIPSTPPALIGGTISEGRYVMTSDVYYIGVDGPPSTFAGYQFIYALEVSGQTFQLADQSVEPDGGLSSLSGTSTTFSPSDAGANVLELTTTCGYPGESIAGYSVVDDDGGSGTQLLINGPLGVNHLVTFTKQ
jgi:hypothetical protein